MDSIFGMGGWFYSLKEIFKMRGAVDGGVRVHAWCPPLRQEAIAAAAAAALSENEKEACQLQRQQRLHV